MSIFKVKPPTYEPVIGPYSPKPVVHLPEHLVMHAEHRYYYEPMFHARVKQAVQVAESFKPKSVEWPTQAIEYGAMVALYLSDLSQGIEG